MIHDLKTWPEFYKHIASGEKTFEMRYADRKYQVGDILELGEYEPDEGYTGEFTRRKVTFILAGDGFGIQEGWVCMAIRPLLPEEITNENP